MTRHSGRSSWRVLIGAALLALAAAQCGQGKTADSNGPDGSGGAPGVIGSGGRPVIGSGGLGFTGGTGGEVAACGAESSMFPIIPGRPGLASVPNFTGQGQAATPPPPISGGTLIVLRDAITVVASDPDRDLVYVVDISDLAAPRVRHTIALAPHDEPGRLIEDGASKVHVALRNRSTLITVDPAAGTVGLRRAVCAMPRGLAYDQAGDRIHVACGNGQLLTFTPTGSAPERTLNLEPDLRDVVVSGERLLISRFRSAQVLVVEKDGQMSRRISLPTFTSDSVHTGTPFEPSVAWRMVGRRDGSAAMVHQRGMHGTVDRRPGGYGGPSCEGIVHTAVTAVGADSTSPPPASPAMPGFVLPVDIALSPDESRVAIVAAGNGHVDGGSHRLFVGGTDDVTQEWRGCGNDGKHGPHGRTCTSGATGGRGGSTAVGGRGGAAAGGTGGAAPVLVLDEVAATSTGGRSGTGGTSGAAVSGGRSGSSGMVAGTPCADLPANVEPTAVAFVGPAALVVQSREPAQLWILQNIDGIAGVVPPPVALSLTEASRGDLGHTVFHSNSGGGLACASCHPEGHEDGRVWAFACEGDRRTQDIGGGLGGSEPFHWSGDLGNFSALVNTVFVGRMSGPSLTGDEASAMLRWIDSVPALPALRGGGEAQVLRGKALFDDPSVACASCHNGSLLTNNTTVDVGTKGAFQVPALRGLTWRAPYMHDGCAPDLLSRFSSATCGGGDAHGRTSQLTEAQRADLVAYLQSL